MISIIIPVYNQGTSLDKCLESIEKQTYVNYEIIVVNDRSKDSLSKILRKHKRKFGNKIEFIHNKKNHGAPYSRNKGFRRANGEYIIFCDADVVMEVNMLEKMRNTLMKNIDASYVYSSFLFGRKLFKLWEFDDDKLKKMPYIHSTSLIRRHHFPLSGWDESIKKLQDWDLWLTMFEEGHKGIWINEVLFFVKPGGTMSNWLPSFIYKIMPFLSKVKKYNQAVEIVMKKHNLK